GLFQFGAQLPAGSGAVVSAPSGFLLNIQPDPGFPPGVAVEVNFTVNLSTPNGLLFDPAASGIPPIFTNPRTGALDFFISTPSANLADNLLALDAGQRGIDIMTSLAWAASGSVGTTFSAPGQTFDGNGLRPRGQLTPVAVVTTTSTSTTSSSTTSTST